MLKNKNVLLFGSVGLIVLAIGMVAILDKFSSPTTDSTDVRARAAIINTLKLNATIDTINETKGTMTVSDVYFADISRSGEAKNLGTWTVTLPASLSLSEITTGTSVVIGVDPATFVITSHTMSALTVTAGVK